MKPPAFKYFDPTTLSEATSVLQSTENAKILAGGQSLMPMLNMRFVLPDAIVDLNRIEELSFIARGNGCFRIGAMTRQREIEFSPVLQAECPILVEAINRVGHRQTRNRGTIGGSLCHLDPAAELVCVASVLDAVVEVQGPSGERKIAFSDFPVGYMMPAIELDEIVTSISIPVWSKSHGYAFVEFARRHGDFALASIAVLLELTADLKISKVAIAVGGVGAVPTRMHEMEGFLNGQLASEELFQRASKCCENLDVVEDPHVPSTYRRRLARVLSLQALGTAYNRALARINADVHPI